MATALKNMKQAVTAFGDPDDHLRIAVLLADRIKQVTAHVAELDAYHTCLQRDASWQDRLSALNHVLQLTPRGVITLVDIDALDQGTAEGEDLYEDRLFRTQRQELLESLLGSVHEGRLAVNRIQFSSRTVTDSLSARSDADLVSPGCRSIRDWLVRTSTLSSREAELTAEVARGDADEHFVSIAYDVLPYSAREAAIRLSVLRNCQTLNGGIGPFEFDKVGGNHPTVSKAAVDRLLECGFLQLRTPGYVEMPRAVRFFLKARACLTAPERLVGDHLWLGHRDMVDMDIEEKIETHFHAVAGMDFEAARDTALYYGADLRELGYRFSVELKNNAKAAEVFEYIVNMIDSGDAYAWEYYAYNMVRAAEAEGDESLNEIAEYAIKAFRRALQLDPDNPLYEGRLLGFRARSGYNIINEFSDGMYRYGKPRYQSDAVTYFAEPVLEGLHRGRKWDQRTALLNTWGDRLKRFSRLRKYCDE